MHRTQISMGMQNLKFFIRPYEGIMGEELAPSAERPSSNDLNGEHRYQ